MHSEFEEYIQPVVSCDITVLAGDIHTKFRLPNIAGKKLWVLGNHEFYADRIDDGVRKLKAVVDSDTTVLSNESYIIDGVRFLGATLWTDFALFAGDDLAAIRRDATECVGTRQSDRVNDFWKIKVAKGNYRKFRPLDAAQLHYQSVRWLEAQLSKTFNGSTIVITHHAPSIKCLTKAARAKRLACSFASNLDWLIEKYQPTAWLHGHIHESVPHFNIGNTRVISNPKGYPDQFNFLFNPTLIIDVPN